MGTYIVLESFVFKCMLNQNIHGVFNALGIIRSCKSSKSQMEWFQDLH